MIVTLDIKIYTKQLPVEYRPYQIKTINYFLCSILEAEIYFKFNLFSFISNTMKIPF